MTPALVLAAHGTRSPEGERTLSALAAAVRAARPRRRVELGYLEISAPPLPEVLAAVRGPVVVVPLLLAGGYHAHIDLPAVLAAHRPDARLAAPLGPHPLLTAALTRRLAAAGLRETDAVVLGAAGSADPAALAGVRAAARRLSARLSRPVTAAFAASGTPTLDRAVARLRSGPPEPGGPTVGARPRTGERAAQRPGAMVRVAVASYLLAPGFFHARLAGAGADLVSAPLGADPGVAALVWHRHDQALHQPAGAPARG